MAIGMILTGAKFAAKALKGSNNSKGNLFKGMKGKFAKVKDGIMDAIGKDKDNEDFTNTGSEATDDELRGRKDREREAAEKLAAEQAAAKKKTMMMYAAIAAVALIFMMKKKR